MGSTIDIEPDKRGKCIRKVGCNLLHKKTTTTVVYSSPKGERICGRTTQLVASPDSEEIEQTRTAGSIAKLYERGANPRQVRRSAIQNRSPSNSPHWGRMSLEVG